MVAMLVLGGSVASKGTS